MNLLDTNVRISWIILSNRKFNISLYCHENDIVFSKLTQENTQNDWPMSPLWFTLQRNLLSVSNADHFEIYLLDGILSNSNLKISQILHLRTTYIKSFTVIFLYKLLFGSFWIKFVVTSSPKNSWYHWICRAGPRSVFW